MVSNNEVYQKIFSFFNFSFGFIFSVLIYLDFLFVIQKFDKA